MSRGALQNLRLLSLTATKIAVFAGAAALFGAIASYPRPVATASYDSQSALRFADDLRAAVDALDYADERIHSTRGFVVPHPSLAGSNHVDSNGDPAATGYLRTWRVTDNVPARSMKTIDIRVEWPGDSPGNEVVLSTVKAS